jgi:diguanylate cyclase (GGDEF)-like protein
MPHTKSNEALMVAERIREKVAFLEVHFEGNTISRTVSIGVTSYPDAQADAPGELLKVADSALYEAKRRGRNRSVLKTVPEGID